MNILHIVMGIFLISISSIVFCGALIYLIDKILEYSKNKYHFTAQESFVICPIILLFCSGFYYIGFYLLIN